jgi:uncharacterized protein (TIGR00369 family)
VPVADVQAPDTSGFSPHARTSPYLDLIGPLLSRRRGERLEFALALDERHLNARGTVHGGVLCALADVALGYAASATQDPPAVLSTASLTVDFAGSARPGETLVALVDVQRVGRKLAFANCYLWCGSRRIARASSVFANTTPEGKTDPG